MISVTPFTHSDDELPTLPQHIAIIMDGNRRWAKNLGQHLSSGHRAGLIATQRIVEFAVQNKFSSLTLYAFSSENWHRPENEVNSLIKLFIYTLKVQIKRLHKHNICLSVIGDLSRFNQKLQNCIVYAQKLTLRNSGLKLNIAASYGGRWDIVQSAKRLAQLVQNDLLKPADIDEQVFNAQVCLTQQKPIDFIIRTGGEQRISNFFLWQSAYAELYFTDILWPDFDTVCFQKALDDFAKRQRRFGSNL